MAYRYSTVFRDELCRRLVEGERVEDLALESEVSAQTLYRWKKQALIDASVRPGVKNLEPDELQRARRRINDLEDELALVKAASALFNGEEVVRPKSSARSSKD